MLSDAARAYAHQLAADAPEPPPEALREAVRILDSPTRSPRREADTA